MISLAASLAAGLCWLMQQPGQSCRGLVVGNWVQQLSVARAPPGSFAGAGFRAGVMTSEQLAITVQDARAHGEKIVFTNGCFDIIHAGYVGYLNEAKKLGDKLVVAINDDNSVRRLKGVVPIIR